MTGYLADPDCALLHGDAATVLTTLPAESVLRGRTPASRNRSLRALRLELVAMLPQVRSSRHESKVRERVVQRVTVDVVQQQATRDRAEGFLPYHLRSLLGRHSIGVELSLEYLAIAKLRLERWNTPSDVARQDDELAEAGQLDLLGDTQP